ncbi:MAG: DUF4271 domain-containing protein [Flavobacteriales bacterium]|nr:DUF4271 domain-containing protein [Flavobacteriales bacterium]
MGTLRAEDFLRSDGITLLLVLVLAGAAWLSSSAPRKWRAILKGLFRMRLSPQMMREDLDLRQRSSLAAFFLSTVLIAVFFRQAMVEQGSDRMGPWGFLGLLGLLLLVVLVHVLLIKGLGAFFKGDGGATEYVSTLLLLLTVNGWTLFPVIVLATYLPGLRTEMMVLGMVLTMALLVFRWFRALWVGRDEGLQFRFILLYLCAAEIGPILIAIQAYWSTAHP